MHTMLPSTAPEEYSIPDDEVEGLGCGEAKWGIIGSPFVRACVGSPKKFPMTESEGLVSRSRIHNWASVCVCVCVSVCLCHLSHSASATGKTTRDREKSSKQKMFLFALRFILPPGHFPLDPLPCPPEGGKMGRGSPGILPVLQPKRQEIEKNFRNKKCSFSRCGLSSSPVISP